MSPVSCSSGPQGRLTVWVLVSVLALCGCGSSGNDASGTEPLDDARVIVAEGDMLTDDVACPNGGVQLARRYTAPFDAITIAAIETAYRKEVEDADAHRVRFITDRGVVGEKPDLGAWLLVLDEAFEDPSPGGFADLSGALDWRRWSTRNAFSTTLDATTLPGEESFCNLNTTGRYPGEGIEPSNFDDDITRFEFLDGFFDSSAWRLNGEDWRDTPDLSASYPVFQQRDAEGTSSLAITAYRHCGPIPGTDETRPYAAGLISSHANPDPAKATTVAPHGFEFRYGYAEARIRLPANGNGVRTAFWLFSDNAYVNAVAGPNTDRHEIDIMEFLPNSEADTNCYAPQPALFADTMLNTERAPDRQFMTYDTIFNAYHYADLSRRSPTDWTFNSSDRYRTRRDLAFAVADEPPFGFTLDANAPGEEGWITFGVLWQADRIEWYVNDVLVHRVVESGEDIPGVQHVAPVYDQRMYLVANLAMGLYGFEGDVDDTLFEPLENGGAGPSVEIDYIRVWQDPSDPAHVRCGFGHERCDLAIGRVPGI